MSDLKELFKDYPINKQKEWDWENWRYAEPSFGSDFEDGTIFPSIVEGETQLRKHQNEYIMSKLFDLKIDPNTLANQLMEIYRLNKVVHKLENALDKACAEIAWIYEGEDIKSTWYADDWKEWALEDEEYEE